MKEIGFMLLSEGKSIKVKAEGTSMYPVIKPGSIIYIEPFNDDIPPVPGEIVAWKREMTFVVHRLTRIVQHNNQINYITRGDSCINEDNPVTSDQMAGRVVRVESSKGKIKNQDELGSKSTYRINRLLVWLYYKIKLFRSILSPRNE